MKTRRSWSRRLLAGGAATALTVAGLVASGGASQADPIAANTSTAIGVKPMMGFNNWARFTCATQTRLDGTSNGYSFQQFMQDQAKAMSDTGLVAAGYTNLTVDDCWMQRTSAGYLHGAATWSGSTTQPGFDWELTAYGNYLHGLGMQMGLYTTSGVNTCQGVPGGILGHEQVDANSLAYWGADSIKVDNCGTTFDNRQQVLTTFANALNTATANNPRKILLNESAPAGANPNSTQKYEAMDYVRGLGQMWRVSPDITLWHNPPTSAWNKPTTYYEGGILQNYTDTIALARYNSPGNSNDADMLLIGDNNQLTLAEQRSQFALWSAMGSPLMISTDVRKMAADPTTYAAQLAILKNSDIIAVDQDSLGAGGYLARREDSANNDTGVDVVVKPLAGGKRAVTVVNKGASTVNYTLDLGLVGFGNLSCSRTARNLWTHANSTVTGSIALSIGSHDNAMYTIDPGSCGGATPTGVIQPVQTAFQTNALCLDAYNGAAAGNKVALWDCHGGTNQQWRRLATGQIQSFQNAAYCVSGDGTGMRLAACNTSDTTQIWTYKRSGQLRLGTKCMDVFGGAVGDKNATVGVYTCGTYQGNQTWSAPFDNPPGA
ncbi:ricin-type beta-trefoil lectin domain protein [Longispora sp. K20-0274]|uniref:ricin-type beta-trefoil lectin domain protein n=1 Tax=Longispora sp. K20-0274 TaxID=3088255 RepID=UPI00399A89DF